MRSLSAQGRAGIEVIAERLRDEVARAVLDAQRRRCERIADELSIRLEWRSLGEASGAPEGRIRRRAFANQESIFNETAAARRVFLQSLPAAIVAAAVLVGLFLGVGPVLWRWATTLTGAALSPTDSLANHAQWHRARAASGLPAADLLVTIGCLAIWALVLTRGVPRRLRAPIAAARMWHEALRDEVRERMRAAYHEAVNEAEEQPLRLRTAPRLASSDAEVLLPRRELTRVWALLLDLGAGAVAISGSRGVGKTTLLDMLTSDGARPGRSASLSINVSAPVRYDAREFLLHLYGTLARTVLAEIGAAVRRGFLTATDGPAIDLRLLTRSLADEGWPGTTPEALRAAVGDLLTHQEAGAAQDQPNTAFAAALYFYATVLDIFIERADLVWSWALSVRRPSITPPDPDDLHLVALAESEYAAELAKAFELEEELYRIGGALPLESPDLAALEHAHRTLPSNPSAAVAILSTVRMRLNLGMPLPTAAAARDPAPG